MTEMVEPQPSFSETLDLIGDPCFSINGAGRVRYANNAARSLLRRQADPVVGVIAESLFPDAFGATFQKECNRALRSGIPCIFEGQYLPANTWLEVRIYPEGAGLTVLIHDSADRRRGVELLDDQARVLERIARARPMREVLEAITALIERNGTGLTSAVFVGEPGSRARLAAGPSLPAEFAKLLETLDVRADGSCIANAAATGKRTVAADLLLEPGEQTFRAAALKHGFRSCWALPINASEGRLLGVLAVFGREPGGPGPNQDALLKTATHLSGIALEREQAEADLRQKEAEYRAIVETVHEALIVIDTQGFVVEANPAACRLRNSDYHMLIGRQASELIRADYHGLLRRLLDEVRQGKEFNGEVACTRKDGSSFPAELTAAPFAYKGKRHILAVVRDVTARKKMEDSLRRSEERLRTVANGAPLILFSLDRNGLFTLSEGQALATLGLRPGEVVGQSAFELYRQEPAIIDNLKMALAGEPRRWVAEIRQRVFETLARPIRSPRGEIVGVSGVAIDVTEQTLILEALRESEERFSASFHQAPVGVAHAAIDGTILRCNDRLSEMLGLLPAEVVGRKLDEFYDATADTEAERSAVRQLLSNEIRTSVATHALNSTNGEATAATITRSLVRGWQGEARYLILIVTPTA